MAATAWCSGSPSRPGYWVPRVVEPEDDPRPERAPDVELPPSVLPDEVAPVLPAVPELLEAPPVPVVDEAPVLPDVPDELDVPPEPGEGLLEVELPAAPMPELEPDDEPLAAGRSLLELDEGPIDPFDDPEADPMPDAEPEAEPLALGPVLLQAASVQTHANGKIHFFTESSFSWLY